MPERIALGILSPIRDDAKLIQYTFEGKRVDAPRGDGEGLYRGILSSVAPIKCLIDLAAEEGRPITKLVYLRSKMTGDSGYITVLDRDVSADQYFREQVLAYYEASGGRLVGGPKAVDDWDFFTPVPYDPADPAGSIQAILDAIGTNNVLVDVDTTGGQRDAAALTTIAIQIIKSRFSTPTANARHVDRVGVGNTVYASANFKTCKGNISRQGDTYDLIDLFHAIESFTKYGKAQELATFFGGEKGPGGTQELVALCESMSAFSDDLALCNMAEVPSRVARIYECVRKLRARYEQGDHMHRGEVLFFSLLDGLQRDFVEDIGAHPTPEQRAHQRIAIIRWCVNRQYLQQALSLVREFYPRCMEELGYIGWGQEPLVPKNSNGRALRGREYRQKANEERIARVTQLAFFRVNNTYIIDYKKLDALLSRCSNRLPSCSHEEGRRLCGLLYPALVAKENFVTVTPGCEDVLPAMLIWYQTLISIRNEIAHANHGRYRNMRRRNARLYASAFSNADAIVSEFDRTQTLSALMLDILKAMDALEGKVRLRLKR